MITIDVRILCSHAHLQVGLNDQDCPGNLRGVQRFHMDFFAGICAYVSKEVLIPHGDKDGLQIGGCGPKEGVLCIESWPHLFSLLIV